MTFLLNDEQRMLRDSAADFLQGQAPVALQRKLRDEQVPAGFDSGVWQQAIDLGWTAAIFPEQHGGLEIGYQGIGAVFGLMGKHLSALPLLSHVVLCGELLLRTGDAAQLQRWLPALIAGEERFALAVDETGRHAPQRIATRARRDGDGWVLDGEKWFVVDGVGASQLLVVARLEDQSAGLFVVPCQMEGLQTSGLQVSALQMVDSRNSAHVLLQGVRLDNAQRLTASDVPTALGAALEAALDRARVCLAAEALGLTREAFERTVAYLKERIQFDVPIGSFQALQHRAARLYVDLELLESCVSAALSAIDQDAPDLPLLASLAKARASDLCEKLLNEAVQMHGGIGVTDEFDLGLFVKRARMIQHSLGDGLFHRNRYAALKGY